MEKITEAHYKRLETRECTIKHMNSFFFPNVQGHLAYSPELVLTSIIKGTLIEKDHLGDWSPAVSD